MKNILKQAFLFFTVFISLNLFAEPHRSDSGIFGKKYQEIQSELNKIVENYPEWMEKVVIGQSEKGVDIEGVLLRRPQLKFKRLILITGATHGNEYLNIADRLIEAIPRDAEATLHEFTLRGGAILIIPILNPDGYDQRKRGNSNRRDLNRDFPNSKIGIKGLSQAETSSLAKYVDELLKENQANLSIAVDYHCCHGSLLYPWSYTLEPMPAKDLAGHKQIAMLMQRFFPRYVHGVTAKVLGYAPRGTSKDFWYLKYGALAFTFEGLYRKESKRLGDHVSWWREILKTQ